VEWKRDGMMSGNEFGRRKTNGGGSSGCVPFIVSPRRGGDDLITIITMLRFLVFCLEHSDLSHRRD